LFYGNACTYGHCHTSTRRWLQGGLRAAERRLGYSRLQGYGLYLASKATAIWRDRERQFSGNSKDEFWLRRIPQVVSGESLEGQKSKSIKVRLKGIDNLSRRLVLEAQITVNLMRQTKYS
jgi:hypothetical protein